MVTPSGPFPAGSPAAAPRAVSEKGHYVASALAAGMFTGAEIAAKLGVRRTTIGRWRRQGRLTARICNEMGEWLYAPPQDLAPHGTRTSERTAPGAKDRSPAGGAV